MHPTYLGGGGLGGGCLLFARRNGGRLFSVLPEIRVSSLVLHHGDAHVIRHQMAKAGAAQEIEPETTATLPAPVGRTIGARLRKSPLGFV